MITLPIVAVIDGTLKLYESRAAIEGDVESPEVEAGLVQVFDSEGRLLVLETPPAARPTKPSRFGVEILPLTLREVDESPQHVGELSQILVDALVRVGGSRDDLGGRQLPELIQIAVDAFGINRVRRSAGQVLGSLLRGLRRPKASNP